MKLSSKKNNSPKNRLNKKVDRIAKNASSVVETKPIDRFKSQNAWDKIACGLTSIDKRFVTWGIAIAASISLVMATNHIFTLQENQIRPTLIEVTTDLPPENVQVVDQPIKEASLNSVTFRPSMSAEKRTSEISVKNAHVQMDTPPHELVIRKERIDSQDIGPFLKHPLLNPVVKLNLIEDNYSPEFGIEFKLKERYTAKRREILHVGVSAEINQTTAVEGNTGYHTNSFFTVQYQNLRKTSNQGWGVKGSFLLHSTAQDTVVKLAVFKKLKNRIKLGTEFQYNKKSQTITPGLTLILG